MIAFGEAEVYLHHGWRRGVVEGDVASLKLGPIDRFGGRKELPQTEEPQIAQRCRGPIELLIYIVALGPVPLQAPQDGGGDLEANLFGLPDKARMRLMPACILSNLGMVEPQRNLHSTHGREEGFYGLEG